MKPSRMALALALALTGCADQGSLSEIAVSRDDQRDVLRITFSLDRGADLRMMERQGVAVLSICGSDRFMMSKRIHRLGEGAKFDVEIPASLDDRAYIDETGLVTTGWPTDLARKSGICLQVGAADMVRAIYMTAEARIDGSPAP